MDDESPRIVGAYEIRNLLGVSRQRAYQLTEHPDFPKPIAILAQGKIWTLDDIEVWIATYRSGGKRGVG